MAAEQDEQVYRIEGMDCASCAATLTTAVSNLPGVRDVTVSVARERMTVQAKAGAVEVALIQSTVRALGFTAQPVVSAHAHGAGCCGGHHAPAADDHHETELSANARQFRIEGMDCASCAATITQALTGLPDVQQAKVSLAREVLTVDVAPDADLARVESTVTALGFGIAPLDAATKPETRAWWDTAKTRHLAVSVLLSLLAYGATLFQPAVEYALFTAVAAFAIFPIAKRAIVAAQLGAFFTIQMLMTIAAVGAVFIGEQLEALLVILLFMVGEFLEGLAAEKARSGIKALGKLLPREAWLVEGGQTRAVPAETLQVGQQVMVRPGDRVPADGEITEGFSSLDESPVTGESVPVAKAVGDPLFAGSVNHDGALQMQVTRAAEDNTIARIIRMVEEAQEAKAPTERFIERFSCVYMPIILAFALAVAVLPPLLGFGDWLTWTYRALALLLIGCPCALVISVPAAIAASLSAGARHGILIKGGAVMEELAKAQAVVFDKTGTLTEGRPRVTDVLSHGATSEQVMALAAGVEQGSSHPLAEAICAAAQAQGIAPASVSDIQVAPGRGMTATASGETLFIGAPRHATAHATLPSALADQIEALERAGKTVAVVALGGTVQGAIALRDEPRASTPAGLEALKGLGLNALMMTGDNARTARAIGERLAIDVEAEMLPEDKAARVRARASGAQVIMVGDGVNDAPALAEAQVGVAIGSGTDVAMEAADAAIMRNDIGDVARMVDLARGTMRNVRQNVVIALGLKAVFLVTTVTGVSGLWMAVLADTGATVLVTLNAMRLLGYLGPVDRSAAQPPASQPPAPGFGAMLPARP